MQDEAYQDFVCGDDDELAGGEFEPGRKGVIDSAGETPTGHVGKDRVAIIDFDEVHAATVDARFGVVHHF